MRGKRAGSGQKRMGKKIGSIGHYSMVGHTLGKGSFARVELAIHRVTKCKVRHCCRRLLVVLYVQFSTEQFIRNSWRYEYETKRCSRAGEQVAIKILDTRKIGDDYFRNSSMREAKILSHLQHPNVARMYETLKVRSKPPHVLCCAVYSAVK